MIWNIIHLLILTIPVILPSSLYRSTGRYMIRFYLAMAHSEKVRRLYVRLWLILLLLYHYVYTWVSPGDFGIMFSTVVCIMMFSFRRSDRWLRILHEHTMRFVIFSFVALALAMVPHLFSLSVSVAMYLLASLFYPSSQVIAKEHSSNHDYRWIEDTGLLVRIYYGRHCLKRHVCGQWLRLKVRAMSNHLKQKKE